MHEGCDRAGYYEQGQFASEYGSPKCLVKIGCWGPVVKCNVPKRGWKAGARVERLLAEIDDPADRDRAEELVTSLIQVYGAGLARILEMVGNDTARTLAGDELIGALLIVHDLHPLTTAERVRGALERVRPYLGSHAGGVRLLGIDPAGVVRLQLEGNCHGCPSSQVTATMAIERAILEDAPEINEVVVEGVAAEPALLQIHPYQGKECAVPEEATT